MDVDQVPQAPSSAGQQQPEESAASASAPGRGTSPGCPAPALTESLLNPMSSPQPVPPAADTPMASTEAAIALNPVEGDQTDTPSPAPTPQEVSTPREHPVSNGGGGSADASPMDETPAGSAGVGGVSEPDSDGVGPPEGSKISWTGQEKFEAVQAILNQNKMLIREINSNHEARLPQGLALNVGLIRELNLNVARVVELYSELGKAVEQLSADDAMLEAPSDVVPENNTMDE